MLTTVAGSEPYRVFALLDEPLWRVLYVYHHLSERAAADALSARLARVDAGVMTALAFNKPDALADEMQKVQDAIVESERSPVAESGDALRAAGEALAERIARGRVLAPEALVS